MKTPVIIPAHNEGMYIGRALDYLDPTLTEPIVVVNGDQTDDTAEVAKGFGATVLILDEQGKLPAQQMAMRYLGKDALDPLLFLDADSHPLFPGRWPGQMLQRLDRNSPSVAVGPIIFQGSNIVDDALRSLRARLRAYRVARSGDTLPFGANMALHMYSKSVLDAFLDLPHIWSGDDFATRDAVTSNGGSAEQITHRKALVAMSARYLAPLVSRIGVNRAETSMAHYERRAAPTAEFSYTSDGRLVPIQRNTR